MIKYALLVLQILCATIATAQYEQVFNVTFTVDEKLAVESISDLRILDNKGQEFQCRYFPGHIVLIDSDKKLDTEANASLRFKFRFSEYSGKNDQSKEYWFDIPIIYLKKEYLVVNIYNLDRKRPDRRFSPLDANRNYTFELAFSGGQLLRNKN